ncbi:hypothetical protein MRX96_009725 [Rhipicephalus microplus]
MYTTNASRSAKQKEPVRLVCSVAVAAPGVDCNVRSRPFAARRGVPSGAVFLQAKLFAFEMAEGREGSLAVSNAFNPLPTLAPLTPESVAGVTATPTWIPPYPALLSRYWLWVSKGRVCVAARVTALGAKYGNGRDTSRCIREQR